MRERMSARFGLDCLSMRVTRHRASARSCNYCAILTSAQISTMGHGVYVRGLEGEGLFSI